MPTCTWLNINRNIALRACLGLMLILSAVFVRAEIYTWTDELGQVHFSDQKDAGKSNVKQVEVAAIGLPRFPYTRYQPLPVKPGQSARSLELAPLRYNLPQNHKLGYYYHGKDCVSPQLMVWGEWREQYPQGLPKDAKVIATLWQSLKQLGYQGTEQTVLGGSKKVLIVPEVVELEVNACVTEVKVGANPDYHAWSFNQANARVKVNWQLYSGDQEEMLLSQITLGVSGDVASNLMMADAVRSSIEESLNNLLSQPQVAERLVEGAEKPGLLQQLSALLQRKSAGNARLAQVMAAITPLKVVLLEYYQMEGRWPRSFREVGIDPDSLHQSGIIKGIELEPNGSLWVDISPGFSQGDYLRFFAQPAMGGMAINWKCASSLDATEYADWFQQCMGL